jgi:hypothetical protein
VTVGFEAAGDILDRLDSINQATKNSVVIFILTTDLVSTIIF